MYVVTAEEMRRLDRMTIDGIGIPAMVLMENAGRAIAHEVLEVIKSRTGAYTARPGDAYMQGQAGPVLPAHGAEEHGRNPRAASRIAGPERPASSGERWLVLAGKGNNGGDGFAAARHLMEAGVEVEAALAVAAGELTGDARQQAEMAARIGVPCLDASQPGTALPWQRYSGVIDALLGTGAAGAPRGAYAALIAAANGCGLPIVAADIPSGLDADTGAVHAPCIRASRTVALAFLKRGLCQYPGLDLAGRVTVAPIGIPERLAREEQVPVQYVDEATISTTLGLDPRQPRRPDTHKGTYGHVLAAAGSGSMLGAGLLAVGAALRAGSGLVTWAIPASLAPLAAGRIPEAMLALLPELPSASGSHEDEPASRNSAAGWPAVRALDLAVAAASRSAVLIGPGLGRWPGDTAWLRQLWESIACPLVLDADALNMLAEAQDYHQWTRPAGASVILTPHPGEMARLLKLPVPTIQQDRIEAARRYARENGVILVLKGAMTVTAAPDGTAYINGTGNPGMATGGSGDVLAGIIASLLAQGYEPQKAAALGVYLHGAAGDRAAAARPMTAASLLAEDIIASL